MLRVDYFMSSAKLLEKFCRDSAEGEQLPESFTDDMKIQRTKPKFGVLKDRA